MQLFYGKVKFLFFAALFLAMSLAGGRADAAQEITDGKAYLELVDAEMSKQDSMHVDALLESDLPMLSMRVRCASDLIVKPQLVMRSAFDTETVNAVGKKSNQKSEQYVEQRDGQMICYGQENGVWFKQSIANLEKSLMTTSWSAKGLARDVKITAQSPESVSLALTIDAKELASAFETSKTLAAAPEFEKFKAFLNGMNALNVAVRVDKQTNCIVETAMDVSDLVKKGMLEALAQSGAEPKDLAIAKQMFADARIVVSARFSQFGKIAPFVVPDEIVKQAVEKPLKGA